MVPCVGIGRHIVGMLLRYVLLRMVVWRMKSDALSDIWLFFNQGDWHRDIPLYVKRPSRLLQIAFSPSPFSYRAVWRRVLLGANVAGSPSQGRSL